MNWKDLKRTDRLVFEMIDPNDLESVRGELEGVILSSSFLCEGYETDTRISGKLKVSDTNYLENSLIRIHHFIDEWDYHQELGTFFVINDDMAFEQGIWQGDLDLRSALYALSVDKWTWHYAIPEGMYTKEALAGIFEVCRRPYQILPLVQDVIYESAVVYEYGDSVLKTVTDICEKCGARLEVTGHGQVVVVPYMQPSSLSPVFELDYAAKDSLVTSGITRSSKRSDMPGRVGVIAKDGQEEVIASVDASSASPASVGRRGYMKVDIYNVSDLAPKTFEGALSYANSKLSESTQEAAEYEVSTLYVPWTQGEVIDLVLDGSRQRCLIKSKDVSLGAGMPCKLNLKAVCDG